jgi:cytochrome c oxidase subunit IV
MLDKIVQCLKSMLSDGHDETAISSKRVVTFLAFVLCAVGFLVDLFSDYAVTQAVYDSMMMIVIAGLGFTASEKFAKNKGGEE